jgi:hypothetical protein
MRSGRDFGNHAAERSMLRKLAHDHFGQNPSLGIDDRRGCLITGGFDSQNRFHRAFLLVPGLANRDLPAAPVAACREVS